MSEAKQFFRVRFSKQGDVRFISHHDLMRLFERALRRARLPVAMSQGFNPRPLFSLPAPLGVGLEGLNEVLDFELAQWVRPDEVRERLARQLPEGIRIESLQNTPSRLERCPKQLCYRVELREGHPVSEARIKALLAAERFLVHRCRDGKSKTVDIRPFVAQIRLAGGALLFLLNATQEGTARPEEVLEALGCTPGLHYLRSSLQRTHVNLSSSL